MTRIFKTMPILLLAIGILAPSVSRGQSPQPDPPTPQPGPQPPPLGPQPPPPGPQPQPGPQPPQGNQPQNPQPETGPVIVEQPKSQQVKAPAPATFSVTATGNPAPAYQWSVNGTPISGATRNAYTTGPTTVANDGDSYTVTVSNGVGNPVISDPAGLTVNPS